MRGPWKQRWASWRRRFADQLFKRGKLVRARYRIVQQLGEGSYGVAYLCQDALRQDRLCVLKRVQPMRGGRRRTRSIHSLEVSMLASLNHPAIPKLYEQFHYCGYYCFTMEYAEGISLEKLLFEEEAVFSEMESLTVISRLLNIIAYVHSQSIVHRDIRIANVIMDGDTLRLIDFGLARKIDEPPESVIPDDLNDDDPMEKLIRRKIHPSSDFYALGHLLLFLLYSDFHNPPEDAEQDVIQGWEQELTGIHPQTKRLLHRLLLVEQPYDHVSDVQAAVADALEALRERATV